MSTAILIFFALNLLTFTVAVNKVFIRIDESHPFFVARWTAVIFVTELLGLINSKSAALGALSIILLMVSLLLFVASVRANRTKPLSLAYSTDMPQHLNRSGPYSFVRHPFYTSYMLTIIAAALAISALWVLPLVVVSGTIYYNAARFEEEKFDKSGLAIEYRQYRSEVGMFFPRLSMLYNSVATLR